MNARELATELTGSTTDDLMVPPDAEVVVTDGESIWAWREVDRVEYDTRTQKVHVVLRG